MVKSPAQRSQRRGLDLESGSRADRQNVTACADASKSLWMIFIVAILLTGSVKHAETAMLEGIRSLDIDATPEEELLPMIVSAAMDPRQWSGPGPPEEMAHAASLLPVELQRVLRLPIDLRHCFVLRLLLAMPREFCARLLGLDVGTVDRDTSLAAQALAQIVQEENKSGIDLQTRLNSKRSGTQRHRLT
jgi:DNA-directed RNA polymerase specialized sigma24 family protein